MTPTADSLQGFRNRLINSDMRIDQRNAGAAVTASGSFPVDRFQIFNSTDGAFSAQQDSSAPTGFVNSLKFTTTTEDGTLTTTQAAQSQQRIEGFNFADLGWGTAFAKTVTLSFWVRSSLTGTFGGSLRNNAQDRSYPFTYLISVADTWEYKTVTIAGDTSGTWLTNNSIGCRVTFGLGGGPDASGTAGAWVGANYSNVTGAVSVIGTLNATWQITGVQLEAGSVATPFERRPYGTELALCQRYFTQTTVETVFPGSTQSLVSASGDNLAVSIQCPVNMRTAPTVSSNLTNANYTTLWTLDVSFVTGDVGKTGTVTLNFFRGTNSYGVALTGATWASTPNLFYVRSTGFISASAEL